MHSKLIFIIKRSSILVLLTILHPIQSSIHPPPMKISTIKLIMLTFLLPRPIEHIINKLSTILTIIRENKLAMMIISLIVDKLALKIRPILHKIVTITVSLPILKFTNIEGTISFIHAPNALSPPILLITSIIHH